MVIVSMTRPDFISGSESSGRGAGRSGITSGAAVAWVGETVGGCGGLRCDLGEFG